MHKIKIEIDLRSKRSATGSCSTKHSFIRVQVDFDSWNPSAVEDLPSFYLRDCTGNGFLHMIRLKFTKKMEWTRIRIRKMQITEQKEMMIDRDLTIKSTGSRALALTAALTASSIFRESMCLSRYSWTDIFSGTINLLLTRYLEIK